MPTKIKVKSLSGELIPAAVVVATDARHHACPTLARTAGDDLFCWYETMDGYARGYKSENLGATWSLYATHVSQLHYPRVLIDFERSYFAAHTGSDLVVYKSDDYGATLGELFGSFSDAQDGPFQFFSDSRNGWLNLVYPNDGGGISQQFHDGGAWFGPTFLANTAGLPGFAVAWDRGLFDYVDRTVTPYAERLKVVLEDENTVGESVATLPGSVDAIPPTGASAVRDVEDAAALLAEQQGRFLWYAARFLALHALGGYATTNSGIGVGVTPDYGATWRRPAPLIP